MINCATCHRIYTRCSQFLDTDWWNFVLIECTIPGLLIKYHDIVVCDPVVKSKEVIVICI